MKLHQRHFDGLGSVFTYMTRPTIKNWKTTIEAALWVANSNRPWRDLPPSFGKWNTIYRRFSKLSARVPWENFLNRYERAGEKYDCYWSFSRWLRNEKTDAEVAASLHAILMALNQLTNRPERKRRRGGRPAIKGQAVPDLTIHQLTDDRWRFIEIGLYPQWTRRGRPSPNSRACLAGALWLAQHGAGWQSMPAEFGPHQRVRRQFMRWTEKGDWESLLNILDGNSSSSHHPNQWSFWGYDLDKAMTDAGLRIMVRALRDLAVVHRPEVGASAPPPIGRS